MSSDFAKSACARWSTRFAQGWAVSAREQSKFGIRGGPQGRLTVTAWSQPERTARADRDRP